MCHKLRAWFLIVMKATNHCLISNETAGRFYFIVTSCPQIFALIYFVNVSCRFFPFMHSYISVLNVVRFMWGLSEETQLALENKTMKKVMPFGLREF